MSVEKDCDVELRATTDDVFNSVHIALVIESTLGLNSFPVYEQSDDSHTPVHEILEILIRERVKGIELVVWRVEWVNFVDNIHAMPEPSAVCVVENLAICGVYAVEGDGKGAGGC
jgi:hypothetical protein